MWEEYYFALSQIPDWLKKPVPFIVESSPLFKKIRAERFLDLGCGVGRNLIYLGKGGFDVVGVDISRSALKKTKAWLKIEGLLNVAVLRASMIKLPFVTKSFHAVISVSVIHHALKRDIKRAVEEVHTVLKDEGLFLVNLLSSTDFRYGSGEKLEEGTFLVLEKFEEKQFREIHHFFSKEEIHTLLARFKEIDVEPIQSGAEKLHKYWKVIAIK